MTFTPALRTGLLTAHVACSVGWLGAVLAFVALSVVGLASQDIATVRGVYLTMLPTAWMVLVPLAFGTVATGILQGLGTAWGLFRHYWVLFKLVMAVFITIVLLIYMETFAIMARIAADASVPLQAVRHASPLVHALLAALVLMISLVLAIYKPTGLTRYGWRRQHQRAGLGGL